MKKAPGGNVHAIVSIHVSAHDQSFALVLPIDRLRVQREGVEEDRGFL